MALDLNHVNWQAGTIGEWFAGVVTAEAVVIAYFGLRSEARSRYADELERQAQRARLEQAHAAQLRFRRRDGHVDRLLLDSSRPRLGRPRRRHTRKGRLT